MNGPFKLKIKVTDASGATVETYTNNQLSQEALVGFQAELTKMMNGFGQYQLEQKSLANQKKA